MITTFKEAKFTILVMVAIWDRTTKGDDDTIGIPDLERWAREEIGDVRDCNKVGEYGVIWED